MARLKNKRGMTEVEAQEALTEAKGNLDVPKLEMDGRDLLGVRGTRYTRGVEEGAQRVKRATDGKRARKRIRAMSTMGTGSLAFGGTGGEYFAPPQVTLPLQDEDDAEATPSKRQCIDEGLLSWKERRPGALVEVPLAPQVTLARAELEELVGQAQERGKKWRSAWRPCAPPKTPPKRPARDKWGSASTPWTRPSAGSPRSGGPHRPPWRDNLGVEGVRRCRHRCLPDARRIMLLCESTCLRQRPLSWRSKRR